MKTIATIITLLFFSSFNIYQAPKHPTNFDAKLVDIEYFSICQCSPKSPVLVRVLYRPSGSDLTGMKMEHKFADGITITVPVEAKDKKGNVVYKFCTSQGKSKQFTTTFISKNGNRSNKIMVNIAADSSIITQGTEPQTFRIN